MSGAGVKPKPNSSARLGVQSESVRIRVNPSKDASESGNDGETSTKAIKNRISTIGMNKSKQRSDSKESSKSKSAEGAKATEDKRKEMQEEKKKQLEKKNEEAKAKREEMEKQKREKEEKKKQEEADKKKRIEEKKVNHIPGKQTTKKGKDLDNDEEDPIAKSLQERIDAGGVT